MLKRYQGRPAKHWSNRKY